MKKIKNLPESSFLKLFFGFLTACFLIGAACMPDRATMFSGLWQIISNPAKLSTNYFALGGFAATFLNMGLVGLIFLVLMLLVKATPNNVTTFGFILTIGFASWGLNVLNILPTVLGVFGYCLVKKEKPGANINAMIFSTGIAPIISELLVRYPNTETVGFNTLGIVLALVVGFFIGFSMPAGLSHAPNVHKGFDLYSAAVPICFMAFFLNAVLFTSMGFKVDDLPGVADITVSSQAAINIFCGVVFGLCVILAGLMGCTPKDYWKLLGAKDHVASVSGKLGNATFLMNVGIYGLFILAYYNVVNLVGAHFFETPVNFNGVTLGIIFCMLCAANSGSHPGNVWPIMLGYALTSWLAGLASNALGGSFSQYISAAGICVGLCFANGLSPISSKYGWFWGMVAASMHYLLVLTVPKMHGGFCLYNGGFTAAAICLLLVPQLERFCKTRQQRLEEKQGASQAKQN